ncbi:MAG: type II toxin-antitoxin system prevent-host-death family antitoxin [Acidobacteria bacterium]|nr:type II toxin-antitoxin system prevent-host-death family antitoxin [Acidobacteriota bacterium]
MEAVGLKALKNRLSEYVRRVESGETVLVTNRDRVVAELTPPRADRSPFLAEALLAEAVAKGWIRPPQVTTPEPPEPVPLAPLSELLAELRQDRDDR